MTITSRMALVTLPYLKYSFYVTGGVFFIPVIFFIQDIVTEVYGYKNAKSMLFVSLFIFIIYVVLFYIMSQITIEQNQLDIDFAVVAKTLPRHAVSFIFSLGIGGTFNNYILAKLKLIFNQKFLALRFFSSTAIGEAIFQLIAVLISWYGAYAIKNLLPLALVSYCYKLFFEILSTPFNIFICRYLKSIQEKNYVF